MKLQVHRLRSRWIFQLQKSVMKAKGSNSLIQNLHSTEFPGTTSSLDSLKSPDVGEAAAVSERNHAVTVLCARRDSI